MVKSYWKDKIRNLELLAQTLTLDRRKKVKIKFIPNSLLFNQSCLQNENPYKTTFREHQDSWPYDSWTSSRLKPMYMSQKLTGTREGQSWCSELPTYQIWHYLQVHGVRIQLNQRTPGWCGLENCLVDRWKRKKQQNLHIWCQKWACYVRLEKTLQVFSSVSHLFSWRLLYTGVDREWILKLKENDTVSRWSEIKADVKLDAEESD
jgi:hypothetical protein